MAGFMDFLFQGQTPPVVTNETNSQGSLPLWYSQYTQGLVNRAIQANSEPLQTYQGQRIAGFTPDQTAAQDFVRNNATAWQPTMAEAGAAMSRGAQGFNQGTLNNFMSPYTSGVVNEIARLGNQNFQENTLSDLNSNFVGSGQFGSQRHMDMAARAARDNNYNIQGQQSLALQRGMDSAMTNYGQWADRDINAGKSLSGLAQANQGLVAGTAGALSASGQEQQNLNQQNLNLGYQDFLEQRNYPMQQISNIQGVLQGNNVAQGSMQTSSAPYQGNMSASPLSQMAGLALMGSAIA